MKARGLAAVLVVVGCRGGDGGSSDTDAATGGGDDAAASTAVADDGGTTAAPGDSGAADTTTGGAGESTGEADGTSTGGDPGPGPELGPLCPDGLPYAWRRPADGDPIDAAEITAVTERYLELLDDLRWFAAVAERTHGWPQSDPEGYWFGSWWSGVTVVKQDGAITFRHGESGADNNGLRTGPMLEGACYRQALWPSDEGEYLVRKLLRAHIAWMLAMERQPDDPDAPLLARAFYPRSVEAQSDGVAYSIDYSQNHPGIDADPSEYVHVPDNPWYGDEWIKNKRSKDDIGHMLRALAQLGACEPTLSADGRAEFEQVRTMYADWARVVEDDGWRIATLDKDGQRWLPPDLLARFLTEVECDAVLSLRLLGSGDEGGFDCGNGIGELDAVVIASNDQNGHILRSFHEAATNNALIVGRPDLAELLSQGLALRLEEAVAGMQGAGDPVPFLGPEGLAEMILHALAVGVPLTWREVGYAHEQLDAAHASYRTEANETMVRVFDPDVPDGEYGFQPHGAGLDFISLGAPLAACASPCVNPSSMPVLDCDAVAAWSPSG